jgi:hypothetical protein
MSKNSDESVDKELDAARASFETVQAQDSGDAIYPVRFSKLWSSSPSRNSFDLARRVRQDVLGGRRIVVVAVMGFQGSRIEHKRGTFADRKVFEGAGKLSFERRLGDALMAR